MERSYNCSVKLNNGNWVTYRKVNHLAKFVKFLDSKFNNNWLWFNVYDNADKSNSNNILKSFQNGINRNVPDKRHIS
ncbi:hypothetical protein BWK57_13585 [Flavobacterium columnare]|uniref:hypothetical protein n=1 Tax=Flavobacterium columnare TaxID=996 RepID=UPI000CDB99B0|nr:hypothetical protein [Flavobacterium columnare]POR19422.1 hypothetical protein BWK57_13585 [Flavobacterium columnare]